MRLDIFMDGGSLVEEDSPATLFSEPKQDRTRAFLRRLLREGQTHPAAKETRERASRIHGLAPEAERRA